MEWAGYYLVPRRPLGLAGFVGPRTLKRRVAALGRGVAREHDGYSAGAFFLCSGSGVRLAAAPLAVFVGGFIFGPCGGMGRHTTLKMWRPLGRAGSSPATGTCVLMGWGCPGFGRCR